jgi:hypothetical protein
MRSWVALALVAMGGWSVGAPALPAQVAPTALAPVARRNVAKLVFDDGVIAVDAHSDGRVVIGAAHGDSTLAISITARGAKEWADSTARIVARRVRTSRTPRAYRSTVSSPDNGAGVSFTRHVERGVSTYRLFFANASYGGFPFEVSKRETGLLVRALRKAAVTARKMGKGEI